MIKKINVENGGIQKKSCEYVIRAVGRDGQSHFQRFQEHRRDNDNIETNSLRAKHFIDESHEFIDPVKKNKIIRLIVK